MFTKSVWCPLRGERATAAHSLLFHFCCFGTVFVHVSCFYIYFDLFLQGSSPKMTAESHCRYEVEWVTEYACHRDYLESHSCKLNSEQHDLSIDLTPLTRLGKQFLHPDFLNWIHLKLMRIIWQSRLTQQSVGSHRHSIPSTLWTQRRRRKLRLLPERVWRSFHWGMWWRQIHIRLPSKRVWKH